METMDFYIPKDNSTSLTRIGKTEFER